MLTAKGARKAGSRLTGASEPMSVSILHVASGKRNIFIKQAQPISSFPGLRADYDRLTLSLSLCELAAAVLPHGKPAEEEFSFMVKALKLFEAHEKPLVHYVWCQLQLMSLSGFMPHLNTCVTSGKRIDESPVHVSPHAGGYVSRGYAEKYTDRFLVRAEVLLGLFATSRLEMPPQHLKFVEESVLTLYPFWRAIVDRPILATEAIMLGIKAGM